MDHLSAQFVADTLIVELKSGKRATRQMSNVVSAGNDLYVMQIQERTGPQLYNVLDRIADDDDDWVFLTSRSVAFLLAAAAIILLLY